MFNFQGPSHSLWAVLYYIIFHSLLSRAFWGFLFISCNTTPNYSRRFSRPSLNAAFLVYHTFSFLSSLFWNFFSHQTHEYDLQLNPWSKLKNLKTYNLSMRFSGFIPIVCLFFKFKTLFPTLIKFNIK